MVSMKEQVKQVVRQEPEEEPVYQGDCSIVVPTGSTLLDLAISGGRVRGGGLPMGILVEIFGPASTGKTVLLMSLGGAAQRLGGQVLFADPEARLNKDFASRFLFDLPRASYFRPDTVSALFSKVREWSPEPVGKPHVVLADSLAALSTDMEMEKEDKMGMRRALELSQQMRVTCRELVRKKLLMVCSNQLRVNLDSGPWGPKQKSTGGISVGYYSSVRLKMQSPRKHIYKTKFKGKEVSGTIGIEVMVEVNKSSVDNPFESAPVSIMYAYGIDDVRENLKFLKHYTGATTYSVGGKSVGRGIDGAIERVERENLEEELRNEVIDLWGELRGALTPARKPKQVYDGRR